MEPPDPFQGFLPPTSNTTYTPNQFFDVVLPYASRGVVRLVGYMIRKTLGWSDADGNPQEPQAVISYRELEQDAGIGHSMIRKAVEEAQAGRFIHCLRPGQPDTRGTQAVSALYELCWNPQSIYISDPSRFDGFFAGNGNLTYIPNEFFDYLLPQESLAVTRVVGAIVRHTIGFQTQYGFRRQQIRMSVTALEKRTHLSREAVRQAIHVALENNYIQLVQAGVFDPNAAKQSLAATYGIKWRDGFGGDRALPAQRALPIEQTVQQSETTPKSCTNEYTYTDDHSKKLYGENSNDSHQPLRKVARNRSEKLHGDHSEKLHGIKITGNNTSINNNSSSPSESETLSAAAASCMVPAPPPSTSSQPTTASASEENQEAYQLLRTTGFDTSIAQRLASTQRLENICRQIAWLPRRNPVRNRLGMLRRAIEENWPEPQGMAPLEPTAHSNGDTGLASRFVSHFYAGWAGNPGEPVSPPSSNDLRAAEPYMARLLKVWPEVARVPEWGRQFGAFTRAAEQENPKTLKSFVLALRHHGDEFFLHFQKQRRAEREKALATARQGHQERFQEAYRLYLRNREREIQETHPEAYTTFQTYTAEKRAVYERGLLSKSRLQAKLLASFDAEESHLERLQAFFADSRECPVPGFWEWDAHGNREGFGRAAERPAEPRIEPA